MAKECGSVNFLISSVDHEPDDLTGVLPLRGRLLRTIVGPPRRPEYWLAELAAPVSWTRNGVTRAIHYLVLTARWQGTAIGPGAKIPVNIWYVLDDSVLGSESFEPSQAVYVAIGMVKVSAMPFWWLRFWSTLFGGT
jgi:hypothetical protein